MPEKVQYMNKEYDNVWKVVLTGDSGVGKTNFLTRYSLGEFQLATKTTVGVEFNCRDVTHNNRKIKLQIWDTAGQERYRSLAHVYYSKAVAIIILYDITKHHTYQNVIDRWIPEVKRHIETDGTDPVLMLVGHKRDLRHLRSVTEEEGQTIANHNRMIFAEASALDDENIERCFEKLVAEVAKREKERLDMAAIMEKDPVIKLGKDKKKKKRKLKLKCKVS